jgi:hypothetical protein
MTAKNDITGDSIANTKGNHKKYAENWDKIFGKKNKENTGVEKNYDMLVTKNAVFRK